MNTLIILGQQVFDWTWKTSIQAALLIVLVLFFQKLLGRWLTPRLRYVLSLLILCRLLLPVALPSPVSLENLFTPTTRHTTRQAVNLRVTKPAGPITPMVAEPVPAAPATALPVVTPFVSPALSHPSALSLAEVLALAWAGGLLALVSLAGWRYAQWCRLIRQGRRLSDTRLLALLDGARQAMGVRRPVTLVAVARLSSPAVFGFWRVRLLLPEAALDQLTDQDLRLLFLHEMAHVRRQDTLLNLLLMTVQFVHWFNPLVWLGLHRLRADRELVCDAMVLQRTSPEERLGYGALLLKLLADFPAVQEMIPTAVPVVSSQRELKRRIVLIKHHRRASLAACVATGLAAATLACASFTGSSQQPPAQPAQDVPSASLDPQSAEGPKVKLLEKEVTIHLDNVPLETVLNYVSTNTGVRIVADKSLPALKKMVSVHLEKVKLGEFFRYVSGHDLQVQVGNELVWVVDGKDPKESMEETRFYRLRGSQEASPTQTKGTNNVTTAITDLERAITNLFKGPKYMIDYKRNVVVARGTPEQLDVIEDIIQASAVDRSGIAQTTNLVVEIDAKGNLTLAQRPVTIDQLRTNLVAESAKRPKLLLNIQADTRAPFKAIVKVMDVVKETSIGGVSVSASNGEAQPEPAQTRPRTLGEPTARPQTWFPLQPLERPSIIATNF